MWLNDAFMCKSNILSFFLGGKVLTLDRLQIRGVQLPNCCFLCGCDEENVNHILLHCIVTRALWDIIFGLIDIKWVLPEIVKETLISWRGSFVGKKRKKIWKSVPLCIFWMVWKERNRLAFRGGVVNIQRLKSSFVCNLWNWAKVYLGEESFSLIGFLEWIASTWGEVVLFGPFSLFEAVAVLYTPCMLCGV